MFLSIPTNFPHNSPRSFHRDCQDHCQGYFRSLTIFPPRSIHHEGGEGEVVGREAVHVHPTAVKSSLPLMGRSYRLEREARRREKEERKTEKEVRKTRRKSAGATVEPTTPARKIEEVPTAAVGGGAAGGAEGLAARLGQRLVVSLPPEPRPGPQSAPLTIDSRQRILLFLIFIPSIFFLSFCP